MAATKVKSISVCGLLVAAGFVASGVLAARADEPDGQLVTASPLAVCESTGFEAVEPGGCGWETGWICGSTFTNCTGPPIAQSCTGDPFVDGDCCINNPNPLNGWYVSASNQHCNQPHISTENPADGTQHLRFSRDPTGGIPPGCTGFHTACRVNAFTPSVGPGIPLGQVTVEMDVAMEKPGFDPVPSSNLTFFTVDDAVPNAFSLYFYMQYYGLWFVYDYDGPSFSFAGFFYGDGAYSNCRVELNPCESEIRYYWNGVLTHSTTVFGPAVRISRAVFASNNYIDGWGVDNYSVTRHESPPCSCGDGLVGVGEECDGDEDALCPNRCGPPGAPDECKCPRGACCYTAPGFGGVCGNNALQTHCAGTFSEWSEGLTCAQISCEEITGACCDAAPDSGGACRDTLRAECHAAYETWTIATSCEDVGCAEVTGACCGSSAVPDQPCIEGVVRADCQEPYEEWNEGLGCTQAECTGACCDRLGGMCAPAATRSQCTCPDCNWYRSVPCVLVACTATLGACCQRGIDFAQCSQTSLPQCDATGGEWTRETDCVFVECTPSFTTIPAVSEWGLAVLTVLLLIGGKLWIGSRRPRIAPPSPTV